MDPLLLQADELGIRLEIVGGLPIWEAKPLLKHQRAVDRIRGTIRAAAQRRAGKNRAGMRLYLRSVAWILS